MSSLSSLSLFSPLRDLPVQETSSLWRAVEGYLDINRKDAARKVVKYIPGQLLIYRNAPALDDNSKIAGIKVTVWKTALKVVSYIATVGVLPILALIVRGLYRRSCALKIHGSDVRYLDIHTAIAKSGLKTEAVKALMNEGALIDKAPPPKPAPDAPWRSAIYRAIEESNEPELKMYLDIVLRENKNGFAQVLKMCVEERKPKCVKLMLDSSAKLNEIKDIDLLMHYAVGGVSSPEKIEILKMLVAAGVNLNVADRQGSTPLMWALEAADFDSIKILLDAGANPFIRNNKHQNLLDIVKRYVNDCSKKNPHRAEDKKLLEVLEKAMQNESYFSQWKNYAQSNLLAKKL